MDLLTGAVQFNGVSKAGLSEMIGLDKYKIDKIDKTSNNLFLELKTETNEKDWSGLLLVEDEKSFYWRTGCENGEVYEYLKKKYDARI